MRFPVSPGALFRPVCFGNSKPWPKSLLLIAAGLLGTLGALADRLTLQHQPTFPFYGIGCLYEKPPYPPAEAIIVHPPTERATGLLSVLLAREYLQIVMSSFNKVILLGNLTRDPEIRTTQSGLSIAKLGLAVNRRFSTKDGEKKEETTFVDIDAFGKQAEVLGQHAAKGTALMVEGRLRLDTWQDKESGQNRSKLGVVLENFQFVGGGRNNGSNSSDDSPRSSASAAAPGPDDFDDSEVPF